MLDRRQRDVHDGRVEDDHELADRNQRQNQPHVICARIGPVIDFDWGVVGLVQARSPELAGKAEYLTRRDA